MCERTNKLTQGSETSQYLVEKKLIKYFESSGERNRRSPNPDFDWGVVRQDVIYLRRVTNCVISKSGWKATS